MTEPRTEIKLFYRHNEDTVCVVTFLCRKGTLQLCGVKGVTVERHGYPTVCFDVDGAITSISPTLFVLLEEDMQIYYAAAFAARLAANTFLGLFSDT